MTAAKPNADSGLSIGLPFLQANAVCIDTDESIPVDAERVQESVGINW